VSAPTPEQIAALATHVAHLRIRLDALAGVPSIQGGDQLLADSRKGLWICGYVCEILTRGAGQALTATDLDELAQILEHPIEGATETFLNEALSYVHGRLPVLAECVEMLESQRDAEDSLDVSLAEHAETLRQVHAILDRLEAMPPSRALQQTLEQVLGTSHLFQIETNLGALQGAQRQAEVLHTRAAALLEKTKAALGDLPD
jgi:hypothetical protein